MTRTPLIDKLLDRRLADPVRFADRVRQRPRATWSPTEPLMVVAADHPARGALAAEVVPMPWLTGNTSSSAA